MRTSNPKSFAVQCLLLLVLALATSNLHAARVTDFKDLNANDEKSLVANIPQITMDNVGLATLDEAIRWLMARGTYENVFVERTSNGDYTITGKPLRLIKAIQFSGVRQVKESDLRAFLDFKVGERFDRKKAVLVAEKIKNFYGENGFYNAIVELNFEKTETKDVRLVFTMQEKDPCRIRSLHFETENKDLNALLQRKFKFQTNRILTTEGVRQMLLDLNSFLIANRYLAAEVIGPDPKYNLAKTWAYLKFEIREPQRWEFYFNGNAFFTPTDIYRALDLRSQERKNVDPASEGSERLRRAYLEKGFANARIETRVVTVVDTFLRRVYYEINEGPRVRIDGIQVEGRISRNFKYYQDFILNNSSELTSQGFYNRQAIENGFKNMEIELRNEGYLHARILSSRIEYNTDKDRATIFIVLEEGPQTQIRALDFLGNKFFSGFELAKVVSLEANTPLELKTFEASIDKLKNFYRNQGFVEMKLLNEGENIIQYNDKGTQARITFQIYEGPRVRVHSIVIDGNTMTKSQVILNEADIELGEILTPTKLDEAIARLNKMGLFSRVDVRTLEEGTSVSERTLVISVTDRKPGVFTFGGGITNERELTLRGFTGLSYNNLFGTARAISGRAEIRSNVAEINYPESEINLGYLEPFLFDTRTRGRVNLTRSEYVFDYKKELSKFTEITIKNRIDFSLERDLTPHLKLTHKAWSLESRKDFERYGRKLPEPNTAFDPNVQGSPNVLQVASMGPQLDLDYRDNPFLPTRGSFTRVATDYSNPNFGSSGGVEFAKIDGGHTFYTRLGSPRWVWANSLRGGFVKNLSQQEGSGVPTDWAFILGGIYTLRGFDITSPQERVPKDGNAGFALGQANQKLIKDKSDYFLVKSELRYPLYGEAFGGVVFYDGGRVHIDDYNFDRSYRDAVGLGIRFNTPVGPAAFDIAWKIRPEKDESPWRWHFYIGTF